MSNKIVEVKKVKHEDLPETLDALQVLKFEYDVEKRYVDEKRARVVGVAEYTIKIYSTRSDERKRFD